MMGTAPATQMQALIVWFQNPLIAVLYLSVPYLFMVYLDVRSKKRERKETLLEETEKKYLEEVVPVVPEASDIAMLHKTEEKSQICQQKSKGRTNFLYGVSAVCFLLAIFASWFGDVISGTFLTMPYRIVYVAMFIALGAIFSLRNIQEQEELAYAYSTREDYRLSVEGYVKPLENELEVAVGKPSQEELTETPESIEQTEDFIDVQIQEPYCEVLPKIKRYEVRHPDDIIDSQC